MERDIVRTRITWEELQELSWWFNFTPRAGGRGTATLRHVQFLQGFLFVPEYCPPMPYRLELVNGAQYLHIYDFPPHRIERLPSCGEWIIFNENVTFVTCEEGGRPVYGARGFQRDVE